MFDIRDGITPAINSSGLKRNVIAQRAGLTSQQLCDIANKRRKLEANEMLKICEIIGVTPNDLLACAVTHASESA